MLFDRRKKQKVYISRECEHTRSTRSIWSRRARTLGRSPLLLSSLLVNVLEVSIPESLVALSWLPCRSASQDQSSWGPPTLVPPSNRTVFFPLLSVNLMDTPHTQEIRERVSVCECVYVCICLSCLSVCLPVCLSVATVQSRTLPCFYIFRTQRQISYATWRSSIPSLPETVSSRDSKFACSLRSSITIHLRLIRGKGSKNSRFVFLFFFFFFFVFQAFFFDPREWKATARCGI